MIKIIYKEKNKEKIEKDILNAFDFVYKKFLIKTSNTTVRVYDKRIDFDNQLGWNTPSWLVAMASNNGNLIDILSPLALKNESSHEAKEFVLILKHEFTHIFFVYLSNGSTRPMWLNEGLANYIAKKHRHDKKIIVKPKFCKTLSTSKDWDKRVKDGAYTISAKFVYFLIKKYSFKKIKELINSLDKEYNYTSFRKIFLKVYNKDVEYIEELFIKENS